MSKCPKCGRKLHLYDWKAECPGCGTNLVYYNSNKKLLEESEKTEIEHALFQPKVDRAKAAFVASKWTVIRIILSVLPIGALFLPLCKINGLSLNIISIFKALSEKNITGYLLKSLSGNLGSVSALFLLLSAVMILVNIVALMSSLGKHGKTRTIVLNSVMFLFAVISIITFSLAKIGASAIGSLVYLVLLYLILIWNVILIKKGIEVKYTTCYIGGLPSETYFEYVKSNMSRSELNRKMLLALEELEEKMLNEEENSGNEQ